MDVVKDVVMSPSVAVLFKEFAAVKDMMEGFMIRTKAAFRGAALAPPFQVGIRWESVEGSIKEKFHEALRNIVDERKPGNISLLFMEKANEIALDC